MASIFSKIIAGEIPCYKIAEDEHFFAFLDINPLAKGHTLVVPKQETDYVFDLDDELLGDLVPLPRRWPEPLRKSSPANALGWRFWDSKFLMLMCIWCPCKAKPTSVLPSLSCNSRRKKWKLWPKDRKSVV